MLQQFFCGVTETFDNKQLVHNISLLIPHICCNHFRFATIAVIIYCNHLRLFMQILQPFLKMKNYLTKKRRSSSKKKLRRRLRRTRKRKSKPVVHLILNK